MRWTYLITTRFFVFFLVVSPLALLSQNSISELRNLRSDTIDVLHYDLSISFLEMNQQKITGTAKIEFQALLSDVSSISLDLENFQIIDINNGNGQTLNYSYNDTLLVVALSQTLNAGDITMLEVTYSGTPPIDPAGFGGLYFMNNQAFNFGVALAAQPHNFGRAWHPCFDNFVERATYNLTVTSLSNKSAYASGELTDLFTDGDGNNVSVWEMNEPIPTYLMAIAVGDYTVVHQTHISNLNGNVIPIMLVALGQDTTNIKNSFQNLTAAFDIYEEAFGPYQWNKIGYVFTPFSNAAMEHATMVTYPAAIATGNLQFETIMAHELAHSWFGNLITCRSAEDMFINEAFATYSEALFLEKLYNPAMGLGELKSKHRRVIQSAHLEDGGFLPLSGVPANATYGIHTYQKGATMVHNLRSYLGDSLFFNAFQALFENHAFQDMDAIELKNNLSQYSNINLEQFFNQYIFEPGFNAVKLKAWEVINNNGSDYEVSLVLEQKKRISDLFFHYRNFPITFMGANWETHTVAVAFDQEIAAFDIVIPFEPIHIFINENERFFQAVTAENISVSNTGLQDLFYAYFRLQTKHLANDSAFVSVAHHRVAPDPIQNSAVNHQFVLSSERYWTVSGIWDAQTEFDGRIFFDARNNNNGNLDNDLFQAHGAIAFHEDSIVLLYRPHTSSEWQEYPNYIRSTMGPPTDGFCRFDILDLKKGEYTFGFRQNPLNTINEVVMQKYVSVFPNPSNEKVQISWKSLSPEQLIIRNQAGQIVKKLNCASKEEVELEIANWPSGVYFIEVSGGDLLHPIQRKLVKN
ncbi:MAG: T9SS type A sorting domain-containing protein [Crocinitomicaceae bacterium]|nr:T9SS type A sorting domain-containing protein [Crocinitomicaceae bacterium]